MPWFVFLIMFVLMIPILSIVLDSSIGKALANRLERGNGLGGAPEITQERIAFLEGEVDRLSQEIHRLDEEGRFMQQLLSDRPERQALTEGDVAMDPTLDGDDQD